ncbi:hypothetical protein LUZ61_013272 [Rhynchospora tenuis]|uniref:Exostosin GT47 domain-containing protein n=1 Tax=Rhynchospora tenuis TaxID=198213 RepID=A0AAD5WBR8_9POAL|nr:hypothetical protein LUZ61_013272 [Rhynchospora tenuis]
MKAPLGINDLCRLFLVWVSIVLSTVFLFSRSPDHLPHPTKHKNISDMNIPWASAVPIPAPDPCAGRYIYVYDLPEKFNKDIVRDCHSLSLWTDMCPFITNSGLGPRLNNTYKDGDGVLQETGWYLTNQWMLDIIFHTRMKQYGCLTTDYSLASAIFVPYYSGLDVTRYLWDHEVARRDKLGMDLVKWLRQRSEWEARGGRVHFLVSGRSTWNLQRGLDEWWGSKFLVIPEVQNMTVLTVERRPSGDNEFAIPYPTYFHPSEVSQVAEWQEKVRSSERPWLFSFAGGRRPDYPHMVRNHLIDQCAQSSRCKLHECHTGGVECNSASNLMKLFMQSKFCLQPPGDTSARRSIFDSMLAGCVPVFFRNESASVQYKWHMPREFESFSVYIWEDEVNAGQVRPEDVLLQYGDEKIREMREEVIRMIPTLIYKDPRNSSENFMDAFDVAVNGVLQRVRESLV